MTTQPKSLDKHQIHLLLDKAGVPSDGFTIAHEVRIAGVIESAVREQYDAELRRLHALNAELLAALRDYVDEDETAEGYGSGVGGPVREKARALIDKAEKEQQ